MSADRPNAADIIPPTGGGAPPPTPGGPKIISLGNGYSIVYPDPSNPYAYQIVPDKSLPAASGESLSPNTVYSNQQQNQRSAADLAEQARQFNEQFGMNKARGDQQQQLAQGEALGVYNGQNTVSRDRLNLDALTQQQNYYKYLSDIASNPRNFVQTFFLQRGAQPPANAAQYGNGGRMPSYAPTPNPMAMSPQPQQQQAANPQAQVPGYNAATQSTGYTSPYQGLSGFNTNGTYRLAANDPDAEKLMAKYPGQYQVGFARGGVTPEPILGRGMVSGRQYMIGEHGPEGIVPANYLPQFLQQRHGQMMGQTQGYAVGGLLGYDASTTDPYRTSNGGDPYTTPDPTFPEPFIAPTPAPYYDPTGSVLTQGATDTGGATTPLAPASNAYDFTQNAAPAGFHWQNGMLVQDASTNTVAPPIQTTPTVAPPQQPRLPVDLNMPRDSYQLINGQFVKTQSETPMQTAPGAPLGLPQTSNGFNAGVTSPNIPGASPLVNSPAGTFGNPIGNRPSFLPGEDQGGGALQSLLAAGALPPFLSRIFGQQRGDQSQGTNQPQRMDLPSDVPIVSKLAFLQMTPSEQQALLSYASSYGVTPEDYLAAIESYSPQGGRAQTPLFGNAFNFARQ